MSDPSLERASELLRTAGLLRLEAEVLKDAVELRKSLLESIQGLREAGLDDQADALEQQLSKSPLVKLSLPSSSLNALPAPAKRRGRPPKNHQADDFSLNDGDAFHVDDTAQ